MTRASESSGAPRAPLDEGVAKIDAPVAVDGPVVKVDTPAVKVDGAVAKVDVRAQRRRALDIKELRARTKLSQSDFAVLVGVALSTLRNWEQGRRMPTGPARALLRAIRKDPQNVIRALARPA